jgi:hypothetical protein
MKVPNLAFIMFGLAAKVSLAQTPGELTGSWTIQVENLQHEVITTAKIHFTDSEVSSCLGGHWKQVVVESSQSSDAEFFPIGDKLSYKLDKATLTIGRNEICDSYKHLSGGLNNGVSNGEYFEFGWGRKQLGYFKLKKSGK